MKFETVIESFGGTPHIRLSRLFPTHQVWIKDERRNPSGSIKDRAAYAMVEEAERNGKLTRGGVIVEPTSGNTGIGLAMIAAAKGYRLILTMPETMSAERRKLLKALGAELVLTPASEGMKGAIEKAKALLNQIPDSWMPMQFDNHANVDIHYRTTAAEIAVDFPKGLDFLVAGVGTAGHATGCATLLKEIYTGMNLVVVEPESSPVISGGSAGAHSIQGIGAGFIPPNINLALVDRVVEVGNEEAFAMVRRLARTEGMLAGISTGANLVAVEKILTEVERTTSILTFAYDSAERYLSINDLWQE